MVGDTVLSISVETVCFVPEKRGKKRLMHFLAYTLRNRIEILCSSTKVTACEYRLPITLLKMMNQSIFFPKIFFLIDLHLIEVITTATL